MKILKLNSNYIIVKTITKSQYLLNPSKYTLLLNNNNVVFGNNNDIIDNLETFNVIVFSIDFTKTKYLKQLLYILLTLVVSTIIAFIIIVLLITFTLI